jgi:hypothetical protein
MKRVAAVAFLAATLAAPAAAGGVESATAVVSPGLVSHRATLTLRLHFEMVCGRPGAGPVKIQLPARMQPMPALAVRIGATPTQARVSGNTVTVQLPRPSGVSCMSIAPGTLTLNLAGVRNPATAGTYFVHAHLRDMAFTAHLAVRS